MAPKLIPEMVRSSLRPLREALDLPENRLTPELMREMFDACSFIASAVDLLWKLIEKLLDEATEGKKLAFFLKESGDSIGEAIKAYARVRDAANRSGTHFPEWEHRLSKLEAARRRAEDVSAEIAALLHWLEAGPPSVNPALLRTSETVEQASYDNIDAVLGRLRADEDV